LTCLATMRSVTNSGCAIASSTGVAHQDELPSLMVGQTLAPVVLRLADVDADAAGARPGPGHKTLVFERLLASVKRRRFFKRPIELRYVSPAVLGPRKARAVAARVYPLMLARI
jgi:hypothetical protein